MNVVTGRDPFPFGQIETGSVTGSETGPLSLRNVPRTFAGTSASRTKSIPVATEPDPATSTALADRRGSEWQLPCQPFCRTSRQRFAGKSDQLNSPRIADLVSVATISFQETSAGGSFAWHTAPARQLVITLSGTLRFETREAETFGIRPGDILFAEDTAGGGHKWRLVDDQPWRRAYVVLQPGVAVPFVASTT